MSISPNETNDDDLSALSWVHEELRRALEAAHKALRRYLKEAEVAAASDVEAVDPSILRTARVQLHQSAGALELVGLPLVAQVLRAGEAAVQRFIAKPGLANAQGVEAVEKLSFAVLDYLSRMMMRKPVAALELFPQYAAVQAVAGAERVHPADLWPHDWQWRPLPDDPTAPSRAPDDEARGEMESLVLALMRHPEPGLQRAMSDLCAGLASQAGDDLGTLWKLAAGFYEAQAGGLLAPDVHSKRVASRLLAQLRASARGAPEASSRLAQDLLFFCARAQAPAEAGQAPRLAAVQAIWPRDEQASVDYAAARLGRFDPAVITQARRRVSTAKDVWSGLAGGELHRMGNLQDSFSLLGESVARLFPGGDTLAEALAAATRAVVASRAAPAPALAMEVATSVLYLEAAMEDGELDHPGLADRVKRLAARVQAVTGGADAQPLEAWMEELYRRISDRQTMGSVVQELRSSLSEVEKQIDQYFREPARRDLLIPVPGQLSSMRGVLSVLGLDEASQAVLHMRHAVDELAQTEADPRQAVQSGSFDRLADNLGALSFLIDMISVQPQLAKSLFHFDAETGALSAVMGQSERSSNFAPLEDPSTAPAALDLPQTPAPVAPPAPATSSGLEDDDEMREVFLEEAREVLADARISIARLAEAPNDAGEMTTVRRAFHTLKGSSRMVGLVDFGDAAWSCEQLYNARLAEPGHMDPDVEGFTVEALDYLSAWVDAIAERRDDGHESAVVTRVADALRIDGERLPLQAWATDDVAASTAPATLELRVPDLPSAADLELPAAPVAAEVPPAAEEVNFELDLGAFDLPEPLAPDAAEDVAGEAAEVAAADMAEGAAAEAADGALEEAAEDLAIDDLPPILPEPSTEAGTDAPAPEGAPQAEPTLDLPDELAVPIELPPEPEVVELSFGDLDLDLPSDAGAEEPITASPGLPEPELEDLPEAAADEEQFKVVGPLRIAIPLFNIFLSEADEQSRRLGTELAEWSLEQEQPIAESTVALAHSLAGNSGTVGFVDLSVLARALEHALMRSQGVGRGSEGESALFSESAEEIRRLLHQFAAGFLQPVDRELLQRLAAHEQQIAELAAQDEAEPALEVLAEPPPPSPAVRPADEDTDLDAVDAIDTDLFPIFEEEADELLPQLRSRLADWIRHPSNSGAAAACMRTLHTFKGGARLAGAMRVGEMAHRLETAIEQLDARGEVVADDVEQLLARADTMASAFERLRHPLPATAAPAVAVAEPPPPPLAEALPLDETVSGLAPEAPPALSDVPIDWSRFSAEIAPAVEPALGDASPGSPSGATVRVRASLLDRLVNEAGEISITRARIEGESRVLQGSLNDLTENLERLRRQLRDIELQAETQISTRMEAAKAAAQSFDPLEMDRFTRFQELTRMMAESVNDVATVQRGLQRSLQSTEDELAAQARLTRDLQDDLLRTRMVEFESLADRLYRVVRQASKETGKAVRMDIVGGAIEVDRGVLERMIGPFEHLLRNSVAHGIESAARRKAACKDATGTLTVTVTHAGNEVAVAFADDGGGFDLPRIRARALERGLLAPDATVDERDLVKLIFEPGFSTAESVSELAGRGIGMDVVRAEVNAMGGRIETSSEPGQGAEFRLVLPLTTAVTQVVMLRFGGHRVAVPSTLVEVVRRTSAADVAQAYDSGSLRHADEDVPFYWLGALLQGGPRGPLGERAQAVIVMRSAAQRVALHVDEVIGNHEVVVKNLGPQLSRLPGIAGITLLPSGAAALIYNPVALATFYGGEARAAMRELPAAPRALEPEPPAAALAPLVLVVDDSLTVRRVTQRLLVREGYRVTLAKDGLEAIERLADERPAVLLSDIEMPRMDGFDLVRNVRADTRLAALPVIMITSRIAQKHRDYAAELGVDHYLGKPYSEEELLELVSRYTVMDEAG